MAERRAPPGTRRAALSLRAEPDRHPHAAAGQPRRRRHRPGGLLRARLRRRLRTAIANYIYVTVKPHSPLFNEPIRLNYSRARRSTASTRSRTTSRASACGFMEIEPPIYISTVGDHPASTGLGSSSAFAVGSAQRAARLPRRARDRRSAGRGGLARRDRACSASRSASRTSTPRRSAASTSSASTPAAASPSSRSGPTQGALASCSTTCCCSGRATSATPARCSTEQQKNTGRKLDALLAMRDHAHRAAGDCSNGLGGPRRGRAHARRRLAAQARAGQHDHERLRSTRGTSARSRPAPIGGKLCGAGGGGCIVFVVPPERQDAVREALQRPDRGAGRATRSTAPGGLPVGD